MVGEKSKAMHSEAGRADLTKLSRRPPPAPRSRKRPIWAGRNSSRAASPSRRWGIESARCRYSLACSADGQRLTSAPLGEVTVLHAPAVSLGVFKRPLHFFSQDLGEDGSAHFTGIRLPNIRSAKARGKHSRQGLLHPIRLQRQAKCVPQHHRRTQNR